MTRLYHKNEILFSVVWIILYCFLLSLGDSLSLLVGIEKIFTLVISLFLSLALFFCLKKLDKLSFYGLCTSCVSPKSILYYLPLVLMISANLWSGCILPSSSLSAVFFVFSMLLVGFLEEVIFRGLLYRALQKESDGVAVWVSSLTFGIGHLLNLFNGSGMELLANFLQVLYATTAGFMFVMLYKKSGSLWPCIIAHGVFNALSVVTKESDLFSVQVISCVVLMLITGGYALFLYRREDALCQRTKGEIEGEVREKI